MFRSQAVQTSFAGKTNRNARPVQLINDEGDALVDIPVE